MSGNIFPSAEIIEDSAVIAASSLAEAVPPANSGEVAQDPFVAVLEEFRRLVPYGKVSGAARLLRISVSHLHSILNGDADAGSKNREKIAQYVAKHRKQRPTEEPLDIETAEADTVTAPVISPIHPTGQEVTVSVPTPSHAALSNLLSMLPVPVILAMIPDVARRVEELLKTTPPPANPPQS